MSGSRRGHGALAIVLHTHMPYVEGFGTWPFGEEWLWEAIATCYLPLLDLLDAGAPLTLSLTPVLCDQLEAPGVGERFERFIREVRGHTHAEDARGLREGGHDGLARELERAWGDYEHALERFRWRSGDLRGAFAPHAQWTSAATHAVLPLLASDAGLRLQVHSGIVAHRARFGNWGGGLWLPECAYAPHLEPLLANAGVRACCVELTRVLGLGAPAHLRPLQGEAEIVLVPVDRATMALVWSSAGYPSHGGYRDYHRHTTHHHNPWANDGGPYDHSRALSLAREHAVDFVARTRARLARDGEGLAGGGLAVCALDTELLGHWWYEGAFWLAAVVDECSRQGLPLVRLDEALQRHEPAPLAAALITSRCAAAGRPAASQDTLCHNAAVRRDAAGTWGEGGDLSTWSGPPVADIAFAARAAELDVLRAGSAAGPAAIRELLALQSSDWAFMVSRGLAVPYARRRFAHHRDALGLALEAGPDADTGGLRNLAAHAPGALPEG